MQNKIILLKRETHTHTHTPHPHTHPNTHPHTHNAASQKGNFAANCFSQSTEMDELMHELRNHRVCFLIKSKCLYQFWQVMSQKNETII